MVSKKQKLLLKYISLKYKAYSKNCIFYFKRELIKFEKLINNVQTDEVALDEKIAKRLEERDRHLRRLETLKGVRYSTSRVFI